MADAYYELKKTSDDQYMFNLHASGPGEVIATSERYTTKQAAQRGIESVRRHASTTKVEDLTKDKDKDKT